jgi:hypothetical protein
VKPWVWSSKNFKPRQGRQKIINGTFFRPIRGLAHFAFDTHGFTVGYFRSSLRDFNWIAGKISTFPFDTLDGEIHFCAMNFTESRRLPIVLPTCSNFFMPETAFENIP